MLTPNPANRPDIFEIEDILETWVDQDHIDINKDALKLKQEELRKLKQKTSKTATKNAPVSSSKDLTPEDIRNLQKKLQKEKAEGSKKHAVPLHSDYQKKMHEELYSKKAKQQPSKTQGKADDFAWDDFNDSKPKKTSKAADAGFEFDFDSHDKKKDEEPKVADDEEEDFFGTSQNKY
mmetsp:Transcript_30637/g.30132  ORF Transcript_30637/g.30132 Transcript_30637/m.30132 type:complete len:178 (+) Transcript_30637:567-1100(+)